METVPNKKNGKKKGAAALFLRGAPGEEGEMRLYGGERHCIYRTESEVLVQKTVENLPVLGYNTLSNPETKMER